MRTQGRIAVAALILAVGPGCLGPKRTDYVSTRAFALRDDSPSTDRLWQAAQETLRRHRFRLDRVDRRRGAITTLPETSQGVLEFWRHDVDTREDLWEATVNPIRRWVELKIVPDENGDRVQLTCVVHKERFSSPDRQFNSTGAAYQYFSDRLPSTTGLVRVGPGHDRWIDIGRDPAMEDYLLRRICDRVDLRPGASPLE